MDLIPYPWTDLVREQAQEENGVIDYEFVNYTAEVEEYFWFMTFSNIFLAPFWYSLFKYEAHGGRTSFAYSVIR